MTKKNERLQARLKYQATRLSPEATAERSAEWDRRETAAIASLIGDRSEEVALAAARESLRLAAARGI